MHTNDALATKVSLAGLASLLLVVSLIVVDAVGVCPLLEAVVLRGGAAGWLRQKLCASSVTR
jgi:hypothetical protein